MMGIIAGKFVSGKSLNRGFLSESEEQMVIMLHARFGNNWSKIASHLPGRTASEISRHWFLHTKKKLDHGTHQPIPSLRANQHQSRKFVSGKSLNRGFLSKSEEQMVIELHARFGNNWSKIASRLPGRTAPEIRRHWFLHTKKKLGNGTHLPIPSLQANQHQSRLLKHEKSLGRRSLSESEEQMVIDLYARFGCSWSKIASHLPGRTASEIRNYWHTHIEKKHRKKGIDSLPHGPISSLPDLSKEDQNKGNETSLESLVRKFNENYKNALKEVRKKGIDFLPHVPISSLPDLSKEDQNKSNETSVESSSIIETNQEEKGTTNPYIKEQSSANLFNFTENSDDGFSTDEVPLIQPHELLEPFFHSSSSISSCSSFSCLSQMAEDLQAPCLDSPKHTSSFWDDRDWPRLDVDDVNFNLFDVFNFDQDDLWAPTIASDQESRDF